MHTDGLNLNRCIFFRDLLVLMGNVSQNISEQQQNELKTKKPIPQTKTNLPKGYRVLSQEMKGNARTLGYLGIDLLEKLILCIVSYGWFKWLSLNISWLYVVILHVYHMQFLQDRMGLSQEKMWRRDWLGKRLDHSSGEKGCRQKRSYLPKHVACQNLQWNLGF